MPAGFATLVWDDGDRSMIEGVLNKLVCCCCWYDWLCRSSVVTIKWKGELIDVLKGNHYTHSWGTPMTRHLGVEPYYLLLYGCCCGEAGSTKDPVRQKRGKQRSTFKGGCSKCGKWGYRGEECHGGKPKKDIWCFICSALREETHIYKLAIRPGNILITNYSCNVNIH